MAALSRKLAGQSFDEVRARHAEAVQQEAERQQRQREKRSEIAGLPQLFLAP
jgi:hypothetical protein